MSERLNNNTYVKIFQAFGLAEIEDLDAHVSDFISDDADPIHVISITPQMCSVGHGSMKSMLP